MKSYAVRLAEQVQGLNGLAGQETQGHRPRIKRYAVAARPGGSSHKSARLAAVSSRGVSRMAHETSRKGVKQFHRTAFLLPRRGGRGAVWVKG